MDYETATDPEINEAVADGLGAYGICGHWGDVLVRNKPFDPCNNPSDAWPIITDNLINICVLPAPHLDFPLWISNCGQLVALNQNPLRAAMIVFLKMKGAE